MTLAAVAAVLVQVLLVAAIGWSTAALAVAAFRHRNRGPAGFRGTKVSHSEVFEPPNPSDEPNGRRSEPGVGWGLPERALLAVAGFVAFAVALMVAHIVTGGAVFGVPGVVPLAAAAVVGLAMQRGAVVPRAVANWWPGRRPAASGSGLTALVLNGLPVPGATRSGGSRTAALRTPPWRLLVPFAVVLAALYVVPVLEAGSGVRTGDSPWHLGWTEQLLAGEPVPAPPVAGELGRNAYPWGFHAVMAAMVRLVPGSDPLLALDALHVVVVAAIPLAAACLARLVDRRAGWPAAAAVGLVGGFGWLVARAPDFVTSPSDARYGADLVVASPNGVYALFPPAIPRELGLVMLGATALLIAQSLRSPRPTLAAAVALGLMGLVSVPLFAAGVAWTVVASLLAPRGTRLRWLMSLLLPTGLVFALWAGPVVANYVRFGGFVNISPRFGMEWPLPTALASWGLLLPAALAGVAIAARRRFRGTRVSPGETFRPLSSTQRTSTSWGLPPEHIVLAFAAATVVLLALAIARSTFGWTLGGNATVLHQGRVWPVAHLLGAAFAGIAAVRAHRWLSRGVLCGDDPPQRWSKAKRTTGSTAVAATSAALVLMAGVASPALASAYLTEILERHHDGFIYSTPDVRPGSFVRRAAAQLDPGDVVRVEGPGSLAFLLFQFSGCALAVYDTPELPGNDLRIRYAELAEEWDRRIAAEGFAPTHLVVPAGEATGEALATGPFRGQRWSLVTA